jgi:hypothetical protein
LALLITDFGAAPHLPLPAGLFAALTNGAQADVLAATSATAGAGGVFGMATVGNGTAVGGGGIVADGIGEAATVGTAAADPEGDTG